MSFEGPTLIPPETPSLEPHEDSPYSKEQEESLKKKIEELHAEIEKTLSILALDNENKEAYVDFQFDSLMDDAEKSLVYENGIVSELSLLERSKILLTSRLHGVLDNLGSYKKIRHRPA